MRPPRDHMDRFNLFPADFKLHGFPRIDIPLLDQPMAMHNDEQLPLGIVPVLPLRDARLADIDAHLPAVGRVHQLREAKVS